MAADGAPGPQGAVANEQTAHAAGSESAATRMAGTAEWGAKLLAGRYQADSAAPAEHWHTGNAVADSSPRLLLEPALSRLYEPSAPDIVFVRPELPLWLGIPGPDEPVQGLLRDCGLVASLSAIAQTHPHALQDAIIEHPDHYAVTLFDVIPAVPGIPIGGVRDGRDVAEPAGTATTYLISKELPADASSGQLIGATATGCVWPGVLEKAIAAADQLSSPASQDHWQQYWADYLRPKIGRARADGLTTPELAPQGYSRLSAGGTNAHDQATLLARLTGRPGAVHTIPAGYPADALYGDLSGLFAAGRPLVFSTRPAGSGELFPTGLTPAHAFSGRSITKEGLLLRNPQGGPNPGPLSMTRVPVYIARTRVRHHPVAAYATLAA